jgi:hypothetical protein
VGVGAEVDVGTTHAPNRTTVRSMIPARCRRETTGGGSFM